MFGNYINRMKKKYYQWRYWNTLYRNMVKQMGIYKENSLGTDIPYMNKPGIALSFDDSYRVHDWYKYGKDIFGYYDVKVTFNINGVHPLEGHREHTQEEIDKLLELQANGHELAHHGFRHKRANGDEHEVWVEEEIEKLFTWMGKQSHSKTKENFRKPVTFAFPHFVYTDEYISKLVPKYFKIVRGHLYKDNVIPFNHTGLAPSICLDGYYSYSLYYLRKIIKLVKQSGKNIILTCHSILPEKYKEENDGWGTWRVPPELIQAIIDESKKNDIEFYTTAEIAGIASFIDRNLEKEIRKKISNNTDRLIKISELLEIKELDLSNKGISNLDGVQYFLNLEKLDISHNQISDFRILQKLPKLKYINTAHNKPVTGKEIGGCTTSTTN